MESSTNYYLIKRNPDFTRNGVIVKRRDKRKGYSETIITSSKKKPPSSKLAPGDVVYVAESSYGIYAQGTVVEVEKVKNFRNINQILDYYSSSNLKDAGYWIDKIIKLRNKKKDNPDAVFRFHEYYLDQQLLDRTIPFISRLSGLSQQGFASPFILLKEEEVNYILDPIYSSVTTLQSEIPSGMRMDLYSLFQRKLPIQHWIDIDHFVPQSLGGPGNIIENLVPIGFSLNRYKSNSVPSGLFKVADEYPDLKNFVPTGLNLDQPVFYTEEHMKEKCRAITDKIKAWESVERARVFFGEVLKYHNPEYYEVIQKFN